MEDGGEKSLRPMTVLDRTAHSLTVAGDEAMVARESLADRATVAQLSGRSCGPRVVIDLEKLRHINCGLGRFSLHLGREILKESKGHFTPVLLFPKGVQQYFPGESFEHIQTAPWKKEGVQRVMRRFVQPFLPKSGIALWHMTNQMSRYLPFDGRVPVVLTIHDLNFMHEAPHDEQLRSVDRKLAEIQKKINRATAIVTDSDYVAGDVRSQLNLGGRRVYVVPLGLPEPPMAAVSRPVFLPAGPFLLSIGNALAHKNFHVLFELIEKLSGQRLVVAGKKATPYGEYLQREISRRQLGDRVILPGEVSDGDRQWLYQHCEAFLFPSLSEGFGFPVLEAMQCGKPVFMSRKTSLPEIAGGNGFYFEAFDATSMASAYWSGMGQFHADQEYGARAKAHAATFSWTATARRYAQIYREILG